MSNQTHVKMHHITQDFPGMPTLTAVQKAIPHLRKLLS